MYSVSKGLENAKRVQTFNSLFSAISFIKRPIDISDPDYFRGPWAIWKDRELVGIVFGREIFVKSAIF